MSTILDPVYLLNLILGSCISSRHYPLYFTHEETEWESCHSSPRSALQRLSSVLLTYCTLLPKGTRQGRYSDRLQKDARKMGVTSKLLKNSSSKVDRRNKEVLKYDSWLWDVNWSGCRILLKGCSQGHCKSRGPWTDAVLDVDINFGHQLDALFKYSKLLPCPQSLWPRRLGALYSHSGCLTCKLPNYPWMTHGSLWSGSPWVRAIPSLHHIHCPA